MELFWLSDRTFFGLAHSFCCVCGCRLSAENRSEVKNVCKSCLHDLEF
jgi:hypothetical protein